MSSSSSSSPSPSAAAAVLSTPLADGVKLYRNALPVDLLRQVNVIEECFPPPVSLVKYACDRNVSSIAHRFERNWQPSNSRPSE